ncbi:MAG: transaldolase [Synergistaceae bacterium]|jgi:transaldolase|nr:transaldolase [Synergistaceae bacterium]
MSHLNELKIKLFMDGADVASMREIAARHPFVKGFTTNPSLMRKSGVADYYAFAREALVIAGDLPISFEVFSDDFEEMEREARVIASWGPNAFVKIPITNTQGISSCPLIERLAADAIKINVTAILSPKQVEETVLALCSATPAIISVFAGRVADTGRDPMPLMRECVALLKAKPQAELLWASPRELLNIFQADDAGCHIITITPDLIAKLNLVDKNLEEYSLETVQMFYRDACAAGLKL